MSDDDSGLELEFVVGGGTKVRANRRRADLLGALKYTVELATALSHPELPALEKILAAVEKEIADAAARAIPLAMGGTVMVQSRNYKPGTDRPYTVEKIARKYIYLRNQYGHDPEAFDIETGRGKLDIYEQIVANDFARIKTFLLEPLATKKGASK